MSTIADSKEEQILNSGDQEIDEGQKRILKRNRFYKKSFSWTSLIPFAMVA
jgi:hypothetical protein